MFKYLVCISWILPLLASQNNDRNQGETGLLSIEDRGQTIEGSQIWQVRFSNGWKQKRAAGEMEDFEPFPGGSNWQKADLQSATRINSPRKEDKKRRNNQKISLFPLNPPGSTKKPNYISVKLPKDIQQHLGQRYGQDKRTILGIPVEHLADNNEPEIVKESPNVNIQRNKESQETETTTVSQYIHYDPDNEEGHHEYYDKNELLPKITKNDARSPEQNPVDSKSERSLWSIAWQAHIYFSGTLFVVLAIYCTVNVCRLHTFSRLFSRGYFLSLNVCMIVIGVSRGIFLFLDAYNTELTLPHPLAYILLNIGYPCITSAFAILFLALLRVTQVELLSPSVQTPRMLAIFCGVHILISLTLDVTVGLVASLQYILLLGQGIFIVWSLLLSSGYFYIYSTLNKVVSRNHFEGPRSVYPKLMFDQTGSGTYSMQIPPSRSNPLSRAVHLTLGVAVLGSLMGGVQLYGMIGMHGLLRADPTMDHRYPAWYGYQVALRILEVMICYLLAVVATTPLRQDSTGGSPGSSGGPCSSCSPLLCCNGDGFCNGCQSTDNPPTQLDEDIYTEICSNNQSVRALNSADSSCYNQAAIMIPLSTVNQQSLAMSTSGQQLTNTLGRKRVPLAGRNSGTCRSEVSGDSSGTADTALYSNMRSRPSSMLFNDSGFVRFRIGEDPSLAQEEVLHQSTHNLAAIAQESDRKEQGSSLSNHPSVHESEGTVVSMKGSHSFNDADLFEPKHPYPTVSPQERPQSSAQTPMQIPDSRLIKSELCSPDKSDVEFLPGLPTRPASGPRPNEPISPQLYNTTGTESETDQGEMYEAPAGLVIPEEEQRSLAQAKAAIGYSESDLSSVDPLYAGRSLYGYGRTPSRCSSISATQSFDMRVYGRTGAATLGRPTDKPKLDNAYYYYGSTRGQKKSSQMGTSREPLRPRPLLPSQRSLADARNVQGSPTPQRVVAGPASTPGQSLYDQIKSRGSGSTSPKEPDNPNFQRSRSLGHHYQRDPSSQTLSGVQMQQAQLLGMQQLPPRPPGPRTPQSVARRVLETVTKRHNRNKNSKQNKGATLLQKTSQRPSKEIMMSAPGSLMQTSDGRLVAIAGHIPAGHFINTSEGLVQTQGPLIQTTDGRLLMARPAMPVRQVSVDREEMFRGREESVYGTYQQPGYAVSSTYADPTTYADPSMYEGQNTERGAMQTYGRLPYGIRLQGEIRQVLGTPPTSRHGMPRPESRGQGRDLWSQSGDLRGQGNPRSESRGATAWQEQTEPKWENHRGALEEDPRGGWQADRLPVQQPDHISARLVASGHHQDQQGRREDQQAARLAGQQYLASPPDLPRQTGERGRGVEVELSRDSPTDLYNDEVELQSFAPSEPTQSFCDGWADNEMDSEVSSCFEGRAQGETHLENLHLNMSPLEYAAIFKQYSEPCSLLAPDITPDSGVVMDQQSNHHPVIDESSDTSESSGGLANESLLARNRYKLVPTQEEKAAVLQGIANLEREPEGNSSKVDELVVSPGESQEKCSQFTAI